MHRVLPTSATKWFLAWTAVGAVFSLQLRWHYDMPWSLSVFWGLADWYLWSFIALLVLVGVKMLKSKGRAALYRTTLYLVAAPLVIGCHVLMTMVAGGSASWPEYLGLSEYFSALYAKKLTLNLLTFTVLVVIGEKLSAGPAKTQPTFQGRMGNNTRVVKCEDIIWGEVCGNYVNLHTKQGLWPTRSSLATLMQQLPGDQFMQINRSRMLNLESVRCLRSVKGRLVIELHDNSALQVSRRFTAQVRQVMRERAGVASGCR